MQKIVRIRSPHMRRKRHRRTDRFNGLVVEKTDKVDLNRLNNLEFFEDQYVHHQR